LKPKVCNITNIKAITTTQYELYPLTRIHSSKIERESIKM